MLAPAGIALSSEERGQLLEMYAQFRPGVAALCEIPEVRYEAPALAVQAEPKLAEWGK
jgi:hypothetical protein